MTEQTAFEIRPLTLVDLPAWAALLAAAFDRTPDDMQRLLRWMHDGWGLVACGAWDGATLAAQYSCLLHHVALPAGTPAAPVTVMPVGMSVNMATHPAYRGRGLIKQVSAPVYAALAAQGAAAGVGFSNAVGIQVDRKSKGYGYREVGKLVTTFGWLRPPRGTVPLVLTHQFPEAAFVPLGSRLDRLQFTWTADLLRQRFARHPFRQYEFGVWRESAQIIGVVVYRRVRFAGLAAASVLGAYAVGEPGTAAQGAALLAQLLARWAAALLREGVRAVHLFSTPGAALPTALHKSALLLQNPYPRNPYFLTARALDAQTPQAIFSLGAWDCTGADIL